ncbi:MAG: hypothetical protein IPG23_16245 [Burkholderiales bacterium]|nr:hypothetical protein [Burkholderiales bacterium]
MPSEFFRVSTTWVVDFSYEGRARRVFKIFGSGIDVSALMTTELRELYGDKAKLIETRQATDEEGGAVPARRRAEKRLLPHRPGRWTDRRQTL